jgi:hypothetical protein
MEIPYFLKVVLIFAALLAVVPLAGICTFGNWRQAKAYTLIWSKTVGGMVLIGCVIALLFL